jgi:ATP-dependent DNA ligase
LSPATTDLEQAQEWLRDLPVTGLEGLVIKGADQPYEGGKRQWLKVKHRNTIDVICAAVIGDREHPDQLVIGLPIDGALRIVGRTAPLTVTASRSLGRLLQEPEGGHPWPAEIKSTALDGFNSGAGTTTLTRVKPVVVEVSADVAWSGKSFRHSVRFIRSRPELNPADVKQGIGSLHLSGPVAHRLLVPGGAPPPDGSSRRA